MRRSGIKRKPVETLLDNEEFGELKSEIKTEPAEIQLLDEASLLVSCCCLCKTSSGDNLAIFDSGPKHDLDIVNKIQSCSGLEISSEANPSAHICCSCLQQLDGHYAFQKQALKHNEYAQNRMAETGVEFDILPEEMRICRFCLQIGKKLLDMYPDGESPEYDLLQKIRACLTIKVNSWDPVTKICRNCIQSIDDLLQFRTKHLLTSEYIQDEIWHYGPSKLAKRIKQEDEDVSKQDLDLDLSLSDPDRSLKENEHTDSKFTGRQKKVAMRPELVQLVGDEVDGKNFSVLHKHDDDQMKIIFADQLFRFHSERENGSSLWKCDDSKLRNCKMKLEIDVTGSCATLLGGVRSHTHSPGTAKLMQCPLGKGMTEMNNKSETFYMFNSRLRSINSYTRCLIFQGFRYYLQQINARGVDSSWRCIKGRRGGCRAKVMCYGIFHSVEIDGVHNHRKLAQGDVETLLVQHGIDTTSTDAISEFQKVNTVKMITEPLRMSTKKIIKKIRAEMKTVGREKNPQIFGLLNQDDSERNFEVIKTGATFKLVQDKYEYRYYDEVSDKSTIWKCKRDTLRHCNVLAKITPDGKHLEIYKGKHNHGTEVEEIFRYPLGKRMIGEEPLWLLKRVFLFDDRRSVVYKGHLFHMYVITEEQGKVRWRCHKNNNCRALLSTKGNFQEVALKNVHSHEKLSQSMFTKLIRGSSTLKVDTDILSFNQQLLSYASTKTRIWDEGENEYETLYHLADARKGTRNIRRFIFRRHTFSFSTVDQNGTSKWICSKRTDSERKVKCGVMAIVAGLFDTIVVSKQHKHEMMSDSKMEHLIKHKTNFPSSIPEHKLSTSNILSLLTQHDPERNFAMGRANNKSLVNFEGEDFRLKLSDPEGTSTWLCNWCQIRKCPVSLHMSANGKQVAYVDPQKQHNHADKQIGVFLQDLGKGQIYDKDEDIVSSYWLFSYPSVYRSNRGIIYQGYKYMLTHIGNSGVSLWRCRHLCKVSIRVEGTFKAIFGKHKHEHERLTDDEIKNITGLEEVDKDLLTGCENSNAIVPTS